MCDRLGLRRMSVRQRIRRNRQVLRGSVSRRSVHRNRYPNDACAHRVHIVIVTAGCATAPVVVNNATGRASWPPSTIRADPCDGAPASRVVVIWTSRPPRPWGGFGCFVHWAATRRTQGRLHVRRFGFIRPCPFQKRFKEASAAEFFRAALERLVASVISSAGLSLRGPLAQFGDVRVYDGTGQRVPPRGRKILPACTAGRRQQVGSGIQHQDRPPGARRRRR